MSTLYAMSFRAMGCQMNFWLDTDLDGQAILQEQPSHVEVLENCLSRFRSNSELSRLNTRLGEWVTVSPTLLANIQAAKQGARSTNGLYNPLILDALEAVGYDRTFEDIHFGTSSPATPTTKLADWHDIKVDVRGQRVCLPARIDLGGVAKGWVAQYMANRLQAHGACLIDIGGDIAARGAPSGEQGWKIAVAEPGNRSDSPPILHIALSDSCVVTSGTDYRRWYQGAHPRHHIIDPATQMPVKTDIATVTVIHPHAPSAEAYAKVILILGIEIGLEWINKQTRTAAMVVRHDGRVFATDNFLAYVV
ncbi:MAG: FAD:protein FMN transferase [Anaerolineaceae bacterium]|nr:FAD:protein FMN transferase [Anaerolineaceae bacterium]